MIMEIGFRYGNMSLCVVTLPIYKEEGTDSRYHPENKKVLRLVCLSSVKLIIVWESNNLTHVLTPTSISAVPVNSANIPMGSGM